MIILAYFQWNPSRAMIPFDLPILGRPILWYGFFFALGFACSVYAFRLLFARFFSLRSGCCVTQARQVASQFVDQSLLLFGLCMLIGARIFDLVFYQDLEVYRGNLLGLFHLWEGGLSSHGGVIGLLVACMILVKKQRVPCSLINLVDVMFPASMIGAFWIRIGNFFNQEILGHPTTMPWGVVFKNAVDGINWVPRHPVQLYEAFVYLVLFAILFFIARKTTVFKNRGAITSLLLVLVFGSRFIIEFFKSEQSALNMSSWMTMGQWLSIPFIIIGCLAIVVKVQSTLKFEQHHE